MADFYNEGDDAGGTGGAVGGSDVPIINGGLLDPRTFPSNLPSRLPMLEGAAPAEPAPDHHVFDAEVEGDIQRARAALPPLPPLGPPLVGGLRHIDAYPGMSNIDPQHPPVATLEDLRRFIDGITIPDYGPHITFVNDQRENPSPDRPVRSALANLVEHGVVDSGFHSVNVNSTTGGHPGSRGNHPPGCAVDINNIDGFRVIHRPDLAGKLQSIFAGEPGIRENYGPAFQVETKTPGQRPIAMPKVAEDHRNHDHFSAQR
jgi:hypothetical protein